MLMLKMSSKIEFAFASNKHLVDPQGKVLN